MHPGDLRTIQQEHTSAPGTRTGWWGLVALVIVMALLVTAVISLSGDRPEGEPQGPQPTEAPLDPGI
jgi:hypothetical protein